MTNKQSNMANANLRSGSSLAIPDLLHRSEVDHQYMLWSRSSVYLTIRLTVHVRARSPMHVRARAPVHIRARSPVKHVKHKSLLLFTCTRCERSIFGCYIALASCSLKPLQLVCSFVLPAGICISHQAYAMKICHLCIRFETFFAIKPVTTKLTSI